MIIIKTFAPNDVHIRTRRDRMTQPNETNKRCTNRNEEKKQMRASAASLFTQLLGDKVD